MNLKQLAEPFPERDVEWRIGQAGKNGKGPWAKVLAYISSRAVQRRLDDVCGPENWRNEFMPGPSGGVLCGISIRVNNEWITKWDGADNTDIEPVKGGLSDSLKRAAVQWGIGRYLYDLDDNWGIIRDDGKHYYISKDKQIQFNWDAPRLPAWALPGTNQREKSAPPQERPEIQESQKHKAFSFAVNAVLQSSRMPLDRVEALFLKTLDQLPKEDGELFDLETLRGCEDQGVFDALLNVLNAEVAKSKKPEYSKEYLKFKSFVEGVVKQAKDNGQGDIWPDGVVSVLNWLVESKVFRSRKELVECKDVRAFATAQKKIEDYQRQYETEEVRV